LQHHHGFMTSFDTARLFMCEITHSDGT